MKYLFLLLFFFPFVTVAQKNDTFPQSWFGRWAGVLEIYSSKGKTQSVPMQLVMQPTDTLGVYQWNIIYSEDTIKGLRPYLLRTIDSSKGHYLCDEMNGIKMESYLLGSKLFCSYTVEGNALISMYEKIGDAMCFEIIFGKTKPISTTYSPKEDGTEGNYEVQTFPVIISQKAILKRKME